MNAIQTINYCLHFQFTSLVLQKSCNSGKVISFEKGILLDAFKKKNNTWAVSVLKIQSRNREGLRQRESFLQASILLMLSFQNYSHLNFVTVTQKMKKETQKQMSI